MSERRVGSSPTILTKNSPHFGDMVKLVDAAPCHLEPSFRTAFNLYKSILEFVEIGVQSKNQEYLPNQIKDRIIAKFKAEYPGQAVTTKMVKKIPVDAEYYSMSLSKLSFFLNNI